MAKKQIVQEEAKATNDAYTGMLAISLIALMIGCALLYLDFSQYGTEPPPAIPSSAPPPAAAPPAPAPAPVPEPAVPPVAPMP